MVSRVKLRAELRTGCRLKVQQPGNQFRLNILNALNVEIIIVRVIATSKILGNTSGYGQAVSGVAVTVSQAE